MADLVPLDLHGLVTRDRALAAGLVDTDLRKLEKEGRIVRLRRGVYVGRAIWADAEPYRAQPLLRMRDDQVLVVDGFPVLDRARTALDMGREHGIVAGVTMRSWPQSRVMDAALDLADPGAETWLESAGRVLVTSLGIGRPQTQFGLSDGRRTVWCDLRVARHAFELDGRQKYGPDLTRGRAPRDVLWEEKKRQDFIAGFKLGVSRITAVDCGTGWAAAQERLHREFAETCARFGTDTSDLPRFLPARPRRDA